MRGIRQRLNDDAAEEIAFRGMDSALAELSRRRTRMRFFGICVVLNLLVWAIAIVFAGPVYSSVSTLFAASDKAGMLLLGVPFGLGLYSAYSALRMKFSDLEENKQLDAEMMASFTYQSDSSRRYFVWLFSCVAGIINVLILIAVNMFFADVL